MAYGDLYEHWTWCCLYFTCFVARIFHIVFKLLYPTILSYSLMACTPVKFETNRTDSISICYHIWNVVYDPDGEHFLFVNKVSETDLTQ